MRSQLVRICTLCDQPYRQGTYRQHAAAHVPLRGKDRTPTVEPSRVRALLAEGMSQSDVARAVGLTRQRVSQIAKETAA